MSDEAPPKAPDAGAPAWVMTFADLMSLLMCFFVLLLAFSEMDVLKFKQLAGSMNEAFGVQREVKAKEIPKGISVIAKEFSPAKPEPTQLNEVRQQTRADLQRNLEIEQGKGEDGEDGSESGEAQDPEVVEVAVEAPDVDASDVREAFAEEISSGLLEVETDAQRIIIRIQEKGAFPSGSATLTQNFEPVVERIGEVLTESEGQIVIAGHTDNVPISTARFRSNWELSSARSVTVVHHLAKVAGIDHTRFLIEGHADTAPLAPNDSAENRAKNRRVEVIIVRGDDIDGGVLETGAGPGVESAPAGAAAPSG